MGTLIWDNGEFISKKTVSISQKRQITIPKKFFSKLGFGSEAECFLRENELVIRPVSVTYGGDFAEQILEDLIGRGYEGKDLLEQFRLEQKNVSAGVQAMKEEAKNAARGAGEYCTFEEVF